MANKKKTHEEFIKELKNINSNIEVIDKYIKSDVNIQCKCLTCNHMWSVRPNNLLHGRGCPVCGKEKQIKSRTVSIDTFLNKIENLNIELIGEYKGISKNTDFRCKLDGYIWNCRPIHILEGHGCPKCANNIRKNHQDFIEELANINSNINILSKYSSNKNHVECECKICGCIWNCKPSNLLSLKRGCPKCSKNKKKTHNEFVEEMNLKNPNIEILGQYKNAATKILCRCKIDNHEWFGTPNALCHGVGCPICSASKGEKEIDIYLKQRNYTYETQKQFNNLLGINNGNLSYDFYLPTYNLLIEYQGEQHEKPVDFDGLGIEYAEDQFIIQKEHDRRKKQYAIDNNIELLEIWYWDFDNIEKILKENL